MTNNSMVATATPHELTAQEDYIVGSLVLYGDMAKLSEAEKMAYYYAVCKRLGLDPMTQPFQFVKLQGRLVLYLGRSGAQQLNHIHKISHNVISRETVNDCYIVTVRATMPDGRYTEDFGAVSLLYPDTTIEWRSGKRSEIPHPKAGQLMTGVDFCNAVMKTITKAHRRTTLNLVAQMAFMASDVEMEDMLNIESAKRNTEQAVQPAASPTDMGFGDTAHAEINIPTD